ELTPAGKIDIHGDTGSHCFTGYRKSLCHGWAAGPTPWLSEHILGIRVLEPGGTTISITPDLGGLDWAEGTYPVPQGIIRVRHERQPDGRIASSIEVPPGVRVV
ncbi:MAG TPA: alpha-L-rhamnosidase, partial [Clostridiales bacterium]|nr:alpha-L-rhamnosidase [Clostridiales bacterium]